MEPVNNQAQAQGDESFDTMRKTIENLTEERSRLLSMLQGMGEGIIAIDLHSKITVINPEAQSLLGCKDVVGKPSSALETPALLEALESAFKNTAELELEFGESGSRKWVEARMAKQEEGGWVVLLRDVTELRRLERIRRDFVANVSHELRTPVSIISANAETLLGGAMAEPEIAERLVDAIDRNSHRLSSLINDLLDLSRLEAGRLTGERLEFGVHDFVEHVASSLRDKAAEEGVSISISIPKGTTIWAIPDALEQIISNFIENAIKYGATGKKVEITAETQDNKVVIYVSDFGPGIKPKHRSRVFERFYRVDPGRSRAMGGTGLGLSIVKHLAESLGGRIGVLPNQPNGARFWVEMASKEN